MHFLSPPCRRLCSQVQRVHHTVFRDSSTRKFTVLAIESSADDTGAAVVTSERQILSNVVLKQLDQHEAYGGIQPLIAMRAHQRNLPIAVRRALDEARMPITDIDGIAFTRGPGIPSCLSVGSNAAKTLAAALNLPLVGVHHMQAHALTPLLTSVPEERPQFPFLTLLVSGGHTLLVLANSLASFRTLATTADESIGRAFDKVSRALGLPWSTHGPGAALERFCLSEPPNNQPLPVIEGFGVPMPRKLAFSYSGLHSAVDRYMTQQKALQRAPLTDLQRLALARTFQGSAVAQLEEKLTLAIRQCLREGLHVQHVVVSGGVASNAFLRKRLRACVTSAFPERPLSLVFPPPRLCTDNAVMIAWASMHRFLADDTDDYSIEQRSKWNLDDLQATNDTIVH